jgi:hypothetical protein
MTCVWTGLDAYLVAFTYALIRLVLAQMLRYIDSTVTRVIVGVA